VLPSRLFTLLAVLAIQPIPLAAAIRPDVRIIRKADTKTTGHRFGFRPLPQNAEALASHSLSFSELRAIGDEDRYRYLIHDRDKVFAKHLDES